VNNEPPTFAQNEEVTVIKPWRIKITKCTWLDEFEKPGFQNLPAKFREEQKAQYTAKPAARFLVIDFSILNPTDRPLTWNSSMPPVFAVRNAQGKEYASVGQNLNADDLSAKIILGAGNINPDTALTGRKVFDVSKDDYVLYVHQGTPRGGWQYAQGDTLFKWSLAPLESK
jgi:hypothetical protein